MLASSSSSSGDIYSSVVSPDSIAIGSNGVCSSVGTHGDEDDEAALREPTALADAVVALREPTALADA